MEGACVKTQPSLAVAFLTVCAAYASQPPPFGGKRQVLDCLKLPGKSKSAPTDAPRAYVR